MNAKLAKDPRFIVAPRYFSKRFRESWNEFSNNANLVGAVKCTELISYGNFGKKSKPTLLRLFSDNNYEVGLLQQPNKSHATFLPLSSGFLSNNGIMSDIRVTKNSISYVELQGHQIVIVIAYTLASRQKAFKRLKDLKKVPQGRCIIIPVQEIGRCIRAKKAMKLDTPTTVAMDG